MALASVDANPPVPYRASTPPLTRSGTSHTVDIVVDSMLSNLRDVTEVGAVPVLGLNKIITIAADILSTISTFLYNDRAYNDLALNASGLVCAVTMECQNILNKGRNMPWGFESTITTLAENLTEIKGFGEKKRRRSFSRRIMFLLTDQLRCAHYRAQLQHCLDTFDTLSKISIRSSVNIILRDVEKAAEDEERKGEDRPMEKGFPEPRSLSKGGEEAPDTRSGSPPQSRTGSSRGSLLSNRSPPPFSHISQVDLIRGSMSDIPSLGIFKNDESAKHSKLGNQNEKRRATS